MRRFLAVLRSFFHSSLLCTFSCHPSPPTILPSSLTSSCHLFLGLLLNLVVPIFKYNTLLGYQELCPVIIIHLFDIIRIHPFIFFVCRCNMLDQNFAFFLSCLPLIISVRRKQGNAHWMLHLPKYKTVMLTTLPTFTFSSYLRKITYTGVWYYTFSVQLCYVCNIYYRFLAQHFFFCY